MTSDSPDRATDVPYGDIDPAGNLADLVAAAARRDPGRAALVDAVNGRMRTWAAVDAEANREAARLIEAGVRAGPTSGRTSQRDTDRYLDGTLWPATHPLVTTR